MRVSDGSAWRKVTNTSANFFVTRNCQRCEIKIPLEAGLIERRNQGAQAERSSRMKAWFLDSVS